VSEGFNADLSSRPVFDGMMIHIAGGGRRGFNERFAQPSRNLTSPTQCLSRNSTMTAMCNGVLICARTTALGGRPARPRMLKNDS
jgi:hypothetical protein